MQQNATSWRKKADVESHPETARVGHQPKASVLDDLGMRPNNQLSFSQSCISLLKPGLTEPARCGGAQSWLFAASLIRRGGGGWCLLVITVTNSCMREWMKSIGRCRSAAGKCHKWRKRYPSYLPSALGQQARHCVCCDYALHLQCDRSAWLYFTCQWDGYSSCYCVCP